MQCLGTPPLSAINWEEYTLRIFYVLTVSRTNCTMCLPDFLQITYKFSMKEEDNFTKTTFKLVLKNIFFHAFLMLNETGS
jgi:hypothetical protein